MTIKELAQEVTYEIIKVGLWVFLGLAVGFTLGRFYQLNRELDRRSPTKVNIEVIQKL